VCGGFFGDPARLGHTGKFPAPTFTHILAILLQTAMAGPAKEVVEWSRPQSQRLSADCR